MADPLSAAGLALGALTLPAQAFSSCVLAYTTISDIRDSGEQISTLFWQFKVQHTRFLVWGENSSIYHDGVTPETLSLPVYEIIVSTLMQILDLLQDVAELRKYYGLHKIPTPNSNELNIAQGEIARQATLVFQVQRSCSLFRRLRWAVKDAQKFASLVDRLAKFNDALYQFAPLTRSPSATSVVDAEALALAIVNEGPQGVLALQQAASNGGNSSLALSTSSYLQGQQVAAVETGPNPPLVHFRPNPNLFISHDRVQMDNLRNDTPNRRSWARLSWHPQAPSTKVVVEWRHYNQGIPRTERNALQVRVEALTMMLRQDPKPPGFRILNCVGYMEDNAKPRFGFIFQFPQHYVHDPAPYAPMTLFQVVSKHGPPLLGDRFQLAASLADSLYELHASRWLHKAVMSHNILFFHPPAVPDGAIQHRSGDRRTVSQPSNPPPQGLLANYFIAGFSLARPDDPGAVSDLVFPDTDVGIYRHPDVQGLRGAFIPPYNMFYDIYSLGAVLLEIGTWCTLRTFYKEGYNGTGFQQRLLSGKVPLLGISMGRSI